jgi:hypothetical protein
MLQEPQCRVTTALSACRGALSTRHSAVRFGGTATTGGTKVDVLASVDTDQNPYSPLRPDATSRDQFQKAHELVLERQDAEVVRLSPGELVPLARWHFRNG